MAAGTVTHIDATLVIAPRKLISLAALAWCCAGVYASGVNVDPQVFQSVVRPFFERHCSECHGADKQKGGLRVDGLLPKSDATDTAEWIAEWILVDPMGLQFISKLDNVKGTLADERLRFTATTNPSLAKLPDGIVKGLAHIADSVVDHLPRVLPKRCELHESPPRAEMRLQQHIERGGKVGLQHGHPHDVRRGQGRRESREAA